MVTNLPMDQRRNLDAQGFAIQRTGFDRKKIPLYAHKGTNLAARGEVQIWFTLEHPNQLNEGESVYLSRKASQGFMPWLPGKDCLRREMKTFKITQDQLTGRTEAKVTGTSHGCLWCRAEQESRGEVEFGVSPEIEPSTDATPPSPVTVQCQYCDYVGKGRTEGQRKNALRLHIRGKHP